MKEHVSSVSFGQRVLEKEMESPSKAETKKGVAEKPGRESQNESDEDITPPSPIQIASDASLASEFGFPDAQELRRIESDTQNRLKAILEVAGVTGLTEIDARTFQDPEILRKLTNRLVFSRKLASHVTSTGLEGALETLPLKPFGSIFDILNWHPYKAWTRLALGLTSAC